MQSDHCNNHTGPQGCTFSIPTMYPKKFQYNISNDRQHYKYVCIKAVLGGYNGQFFRVKVETAKLIVGRWFFAAMSSLKGKVYSNMSAKVIQTMAFTQIMVMWTPWISFWDHLNYVKWSRKNWRWMSKSYNIAKIMKHSRKNEGAVHALVHSILFIERLKFIILNSWYGPKLPGADPENRSWGGTEIRGQFPCTHQHVRFTFMRVSWWKWGHFCPDSGGIRSKIWGFCQSWGAMTPLPPLHLVG